jgi:hypothetical protein
LDLEELLVDAETEAETPVTPVGSDGERDLDTAHNDALRPKEEPIPEGHARFWVAAYVAPNGVNICTFGLHGTASIIVDPGLWEVAQEYVDRLNPDGHLIALTPTAGLVRLKNAL